jgi:hypothetical protein
MDVMPVASDGDGENENYDYDERAVFQTFMRRGAASTGLVTFSRTIAMLWHGIHFIGRYSAYPEAAN